MSQYRTGAEDAGTGAIRDDATSGTHDGGTDGAGAHDDDGNGDVTDGAGTYDGGGEADALPEYAERVLDVAELIPPGRVMTYGDVAEWLGDGGPRQVGRVMALYGAAVPWWRVVRADGTLLPGHELRALDHYRAESTPLREASRGAAGHLPRLDMKRARWNGAVGDADGDADADRDADGGAHT
ncbi:MGMT family protein [Streptomyces sp. NPDC056061]|uniref:MGMT family protein n=1 Tax=Streptomyces sp. NPDC056061 TaxID=3345700 RepID=UPI0035D6EE73